MFLTSFASSLMISSGRRPSSADSTSNGWIGLYGASFLCHTAAPGRSARVRTPGERGGACQEEDEDEDEEEEEERRRTRTRTRRRRRRRR